MKDIESLNKLNPHSRST